MPLNRPIVNYSDIKTIPGIGISSRAIIGSPANWPIRRAAIQRVEKNIKACNMLAGIESDPWRVRVEAVKRVDATYPGWTVVAIRRPRPRPSARP